MIQRPALDEWFAQRPKRISPLAGLLQTVMKSKSILDLPPDWDDAGSPQIQRETWTRAVVFLLFHAAILWTRSEAMMPNPRILAGPDGSVDLHWKTRRRELLINVPSDPAQTLAYYGDDYESERRKGALEPGEINPDLFTWLTIID
ncbi:MAG: hypothetical protein ACJ76J_11160 [Thermoanaerobaculia bacterium]